jgi:hypothetical protein
MWSFRGVIADRRLRTRNLDLLIVSSRDSGFAVG